ncbi:MAG TPA: alpha/beta hydrolase [Solirubrobacteraceae bacterium]|jgi:acetyl esterase
MNYLRGVPEHVADEELAAYLRQPATLGGLDVAAMREGIALRAKTRAPGPSMHEVRELRIGALPARLHRPVAETSALVVYLHGGGWTVGSLESHDRMCRRLASGAGLAVLAIEYRLAPEHPWPASVDDSVAALRWVASRPEDLGFEPSAVVVAGDSAGGTLAALACIRLRDEAPEALPSLQLLLYANTDLTGSQPSMREKATGFGLEVETVRFFNSQWVPDETRWGDPGISPLHARDLSGLPSALVVSAEHDPLRDESEAYARRLLEAGVEVELRREPGLIHGFMTLDEVSPACAAAADRVAADLKARLSA